MGQISARSDTVLEVALELGKQCPRPRGGGGGGEGGGEYLTNSVHARLGRIFDINDIM